MSNTLSRMEKPRIAIKFKRGDIVNARGQIGVIIDVLESAEMDNICLGDQIIGSSANYNCRQPISARYGIMSSR